MKTQGVSMGYRIPTNPRSGVVSIPAEPVTEYRIPPLAPAPVAAANENFRRLAAEYADVQGRLSEAFALRESELGKVHAAAAQARIEGKRPPTKTTHTVEAEWDERLAVLRSELAAVADAVDQAGDTLLASIETHKEEWLAAFIEQDVTKTKAL